MTAPILVCRDLVKRFGETIALGGAGLQVGEGSLTALLGPSGCGKTTLLRLIAGFETPDAGVIELRGREISSPSRCWPPERRRVAMVFQDFALFPHLNVGANVAFGLPKGSPRRKRVSELLALVRLEGLEERMPHELSGGQQQRVALARAFGAEPDLILMDEPFSNLDPSVRDEVRNEVRALLRSVGITALVVTHDQEEALSFADKVAVMIAGRILQIGAPAEVYGRPVSREVGEFLGRPNVLPGTVSDSQLTCALGRFPSDGLHDGEVDLLFRAEALSIVEAGGVSANVVNLDYFGHDHLVLVQLLTGEHLRVRQLAGLTFEIGQHVRVAPRGVPLMFPRGPQAAR